MLYLSKIKETYNFSHTLVILFTIWVNILNLKEIIEKKLTHPSKSIRCAFELDDTPNSKLLKEHVNIRSYFLMAICGGDRIESLYAMTAAAYRTGRGEGRRRKEENLDELLDFSSGWGVTATTTHMRCWEFRWMRKVARRGFVLLGLRVRIRYMGGGNHNLQSPFYLDDMWRIQF